MLEKRDFAGNY